MAMGGNKRFDSAGGKASGLTATKTQLAPFNCTTWKPTPPNLRTLPLPTQRLWHKWKRFWGGNTSRRPIGILRRSYGRGLNEAFCAQAILSRQWGAPVGNPLAQRGSCPLLSQIALPAKAAPCESGLGTTRLGFLTTTKPTPPPLSVPRTGDLRRLSSRANRADGAPSSADIFSAA